MRMNTLKAIIKTAARGAAVLLVGAGMAGAQTVSLTAAPAIATLPDGSAVPMWGYTCGTPVQGSTVTCAALNPTAATAGGWSPGGITVPAGTNPSISPTHTPPAPLPTPQPILAHLS